MTDPVFQVSDLLVVLSDGRVIESKPVRIVDALVTQNIVGNWVNVQPVSFTSGSLGGAVALSNSTIAENTVAAITIGTLSVPGGDTWAFTLVTGYDAGGRVALSGASLITTATAFDYEVQTSYEIRVKAVRTSPTYAEIVSSFTLTVTDVLDIINGALNSQNAQGSALIMLLIMDD